MRKNNTLFISETGRAYKKIPSSLPQKLRNETDLDFRARRTPYCGQYRTVRRDEEMMSDIADSLPS